MGTLGIFFVCYFGSMFLKIIGVSGFKEIGWGWFLIAPILFPILRGLFWVLQWVFYCAMGFAVTYYAAKLVVWALSNHH